jgi:hypothetical protein
MDSIVVEFPFVSWSNCPVPTSVSVFVQVINIARSYPPQPEMGEYPGRDFTETMEGSTSAAPSPPRASKRQRVADVTQDSEDLDDTHLSSGDDYNSGIPASPLSRRSPPRLEKRIVPKFGIDAS